MNRARTSIMVSVMFLFSTLSNAATNLDVMVVFSNDVSLSTAQKALVAARYQLALTVVFEKLDGTNTVTVWPLLAPSMSYNATINTSLDAALWMRGENQNLVSPLRIAREALGSPGADLIIMVVSDTTDSVCGRALPIPRVATTSNSEKNAFAVVVLEDTHPSCDEEITVPHEIGHLLYAEHETDLNGDTSLPSYSNHAIQSAGGLRSLMWNGLSIQVTDLLSGYLPSMTSGFADNVDFMSRRSFEIASLYRAPPPTQNGFNCAVEYQGCVANAEQWLVTHSQNVAMSQVFLDRSYNGGGTWWPETTGGLTCVPQVVTSTNKFRVSGITLSGSLAEGCVITIQGGQDCEEEFAW